MIFLNFWSSARARPKSSQNDLPRTSPGRPRGPPGTPPYGDIGQVFSIWTPQARPRQFFGGPGAVRGRLGLSREGFWATWAPRASGQTKNDLRGTILASIFMIFQEFIAKTNRIEKKMLQASPKRVLLNEQATGGLATKTNVFWRRRSEANFPLFLLFSHCRKYMPSEAKRSEAKQSKANQSKAKQSRAKQSRAKQNKEASNCTQQASRT